MKNNPTDFRGVAAFLMVWTGAMLMLDAAAGVHWFQPGDFDWRTAMAYHGILIPAWMLLVLAYARTAAELSEPSRQWIRAGAAGAAIFTGVGGLLIRREGLSAGALLQILGLTFADVTALIALVSAFRDHFRRKEFAGEQRLAWWTVSIAMVALSLATPLGHLAGAVRDLGKSFFLFSAHVSALGKPADAVLDGYVGSHSHQIVAAFLAAAFVLPLLRSSQAPGGIAQRARRLGLALVLAATVAQAGLYQYCAWLAWEPPDLFANGPNGMPLDDFVLALLGIGLLLLVPALWAAPAKTESRPPAHPAAMGRLTAALLLCFLAGVVALGVWIEFHEGFFGHAEGAAPGVANDEAYIRAHMLFGFMILPLLLGTLLHAHSFLTNRRRDRLFAILVSVIAALGTAGVFLWTFSLDALLLEIALAGTALSLPVVGGLPALARRAV